MIWTPPPEPHIGERRITRRFAWWPVDLANGDRCWLERIYVVEEYGVVYLDLEGGHVYGWKTLARTTANPSSIVERAP